MTFDELTTPLTTAEAEAAIYSALAARGVTTTGWKSGSVVRAAISGSAIMHGAFSRLQVAIAKSGFLELAEGDWLELVALYVYGVKKDKGSFATGNVQLNNTGGGVYSGDAGDLVFLNTTTGQTYRNTQAFSIGALETGVLVPVQAVELGATVSNPAEINALETPLLGVAVNNPSSIVGTAPETDPELRIRCAEKLGTLSSNGPRDAYNFIARSAKRANGQSIGVTRVRTIADGNGNVDVYVATPTGTVAAPDVAVINSAIQEKVVPVGVTATVESATPLLIPITYELWVRDTSGLTDGEIEDAVSDRLIAFMASQAIGGNVLSGSPGRVYVSAISTVIGSALPDAIVKVAVTAPATDVDIAATEAPVLGLVTPTDIHQVSGGVV